MFLFTVNFHAFAVKRDLQVLCEPGKGQFCMDGSRNSRSDPIELF